MRRKTMCSNRLLRWQKGKKSQASRCDFLQHLLPENFNALPVIHYVNLDALQWMQWKGISCSSLPPDSADAVYALCYLSSFSYNLCGSLLQSSGDQLANGKARKTLIPSILTHTLTRGLRKKIVLRLMFLVINVPASPLFACLSHQSG